MNIIIGNQQIIEKGKPLLDLDEAPIVIFYDKTDQSLKFTLNGSDHPDSVLYHVIPGDRISVKIAASVIFYDKEQFYQYSYQIQSLEESEVPIKIFSTDLGFEPYEISAPDSWSTNQQSGFITWHHASSPLLKPGESISGLSIKSSGPPKLGTLFVRGESNVLYELDYYDGPPLYISNHLTPHQRVECITLIPSPAPEKIEADGWIKKIEDGIGRLRSNGYITKEEASNISEILSKLFNQMYYNQNPIFETWNGYIESALSDLAPYESEMEPEAWSYITENLKYMQRNKDIVWFGK